MNEAGKNHLEDNILKRISDQKDGICTDKLKPGTFIQIETLNSKYKMLVLEGNVMLICGGKHFPQWQKIHFHGSTWGTKMLKINWIGRNMNMEFNDTYNQYLTTAVQELSIDYPDGWSHHANWKQI